MADAVLMPPVAAHQRTIPPAFFNLCFVLIVVTASYFPASLFARWWIYNPDGLGIPTDFINVWAAGKLALEGHAAQAWDWDIQKQVELAVLRQDFDGYFAWHYPPPFLFIASLLAHFPYAVAFIGWASVSMLPYLVVMRAIVGRPFGLMLAIAFPAVANNIMVGQNGFLTAALIGGTLYLMPSRPVLAGICLGMLSYKPQYGLLFPLVLIAAAEWRTFFAAAIVAVSLALVSWLAFGTESWLAFFHWMPMFSQAFLTEGKAPWFKLQSIFALVRYFGGTEQLAWILQWILTATVAAVLAMMWRSRVPYTLKAAALAAGTLLTTPYLFMYDMVVLAIAVGFLMRLGFEEGFARYEFAILGCVFGLLASFLFLGEPVGFAATLLVTGLVLRRAGRWWRAPILTLAHA